MLPASRPAESPPGRSRRSQPVGPASAGLRPGRGLASPTSPSLRLGGPPVGFLRAARGRPAGWLTPRPPGSARTRPRTMSVNIASRSPLRGLVRDLSDGDMLRFLGRERGEDYGTNFLVMLNAWEGAVGFLAARGASQVESETWPLETAKFLGWVSPHSERGPHVLRMSDVALACNAALNLIKGIVQRLGRRGGPSTLPAGRCARADAPAGRQRPSPPRPVGCG
jgi:hypothetical protein